MRLKRKINSIMDKKLEDEFYMEAYEEHIFSEGFKKRKQQLLNEQKNDESKLRWLLESEKTGESETDLTDIEKWKKDRRPSVSGRRAASTQHKITVSKNFVRVVAMTGVLFITFSVGVFAATKFENFFTVEKKGTYEVQLVVKPEQSLIATQRYAKLNISYLPQGLLEVSGSSGLKFFFEGNIYQEGVAFQLFDVNQIQDEAVLENLNVISTDMLDINGNRAIFIKADDTIEKSVGLDKYSKEMYIYFGEQNYLVKIQACSLISDEELLQIGEGISIEAADEATATVCSNWQNGSVNPEQSYVVDELPEEEIHIYGKGEEFIDKVLSREEGTEGDLTYRVDEISISDNFDQMGNGVLMSECYSYLDDTGNLIPNKLVYISDGDGINTLSSVVAEEIVSQKVLYLTVTIRNDSDVDFENFKPHIQLAQMKLEDGNYRLVKYSRDIECDRVSSTADLIQRGIIYYDYVGAYGFAGIDMLAAGEERTVHVAFCVNECDLPYLYINTSAKNGKYYFYEKNTEQESSAFNYVKVQK